MTVALDDVISQAVYGYLDWMAANRFGQRFRERDFEWPPHKVASLGDERGSIVFHYGQDQDHVSGHPGGLALMVWSKLPGWPDDIPLINLDMAHDIRDAVTRRLRDPIVAALEERGIPFMPVSLNAYQHVARPGGSAATVVVDRDGLQCVFRVADRFYVSGFDVNETPPLYFLARLPGPAATYADAIESLKPASVKLAESQGVAVLRQGDMFAIPTGLDSDALGSLGAVFATEVSRQVLQPSWRMVSPFTWDENGVVTFTNRTAEPGQVDTVTQTQRRGLYGTAHTATELAYLPDDGTMFARGTIRHDPRGVLLERRDPDHGDLVLPGTDWFLVVRNTVPTTDAT